MKCIYYKFENSNDIHKARFLNNCRKKYKGFDMVRILPLTQSHGICKIPKKCIINEPIKQ